MSSERSQKQGRHDQKKVSKVDEYSSLLSIKHAFLLIRKFIKKERITLIVGKKDDFDELSEGRSFLLNKAMET
ncbi:MAG TPA: hypothetical protein VNJ08_04595 [Bacteriovoracaceae bacterium]|nr:hypothetical protein [Bacteriovoracaceae bacterium]